MAKKKYFFKLIITPTVIKEAEESSIYEALLAWRTSMKTQDKPSNRLPDWKCLCRLALCRPQNLNELSGVEGMGPNIIEECGQELLEILLQLYDEADKHA